MKRLIKYLQFFNLYTSLILYITFKFRSLNTACIKYKGKRLYLRPGRSDYEALEQVLIGNQYECKAHISQPSVIIDGGANIGLSSAYFAQKFPQAKIYSFEPNQENFELLRKNTSEYPNVFCFRMGIWSKTGPIFLNKGGSDMDFYITDTRQANSMEEINCTSIQDFMERQGIQTVDIMKLDIEGSEFQILKEENAAWLDRVGCLMIETHDRFVKGTSERLFRTMLQYDFDLEVSGETLKFFYLKRK